MKKIKYFPLVSVIVLSWNAKEYLQNCLNSVLKSEYPFFEIIVSDNGSEDGSIQIVKKSFPDVVLIENKINLGYSRGNNVAIEQSKGDIVILLNQDTYVSKDWIEEIVKVSKNPKVGIIGCKVYYPNTNIVQSIGFDVLPSGYPHPRGATKIDNGQFDKIIDVDYVAGTALAIKRSVINKIGRLDPKFSAYYEDADWCYRARNAGYKIVVAPKAFIYHFGSISFGKNSLNQMYLYQKNRIRFVTEHFFGMQFFKTFVLFDFKRTVTKIRQWLEGDLTIQREPNLRHQLGNIPPNPNYVVTTKAIINDFVGKILAYLSIFLMTRPQPKNGKTEKADS